MATGDVPGANPANADDLHAGCWAEHADGSLLFVKGAEGDKVIYELFDLQPDRQPVSYSDAMERRAFERTFSAPPTGKSGTRWTWHDKTPMPWDRVMDTFDKQTPRYADVKDQLSAAARVAESLNLRAHTLAAEEVTPRVEQARERGWKIMERIAEALGGFRGDA